METVICFLCEKEVPKSEAIDDSIPIYIDGDEEYQDTDWDYRYFCSVECQEKKWKEEL